jgi:prepilin-type processing-associated H-X9-DG protein
VLAACCGLGKAALRETNGIATLPRRLGWTMVLNRRKFKAMKPRVSHQKTAALTRADALVILVLVAIAVLFWPFLFPQQAQRMAHKINCVNNLAQIGLAYRIWEGDHNDKYPMQVSVTNGGAMELVSEGNAWINFSVMSNELSVPFYLICPQDAKHQPPATNFSQQLAGHLSYFVGLARKESDPQSILSGDDNFEIIGVPRRSGLLELSSNTPIAWTPDRHGFGGNILLGDGSVQSLANSNLVRQFNQTGLATNRLAIP